MQENNNQIVSLNNLVTEIKFFENQAVNSYWEIGKRLSIAKQQVGHGNWINWVNDNLGYTRQTASNLIKVYETYPNGNSSLHLNFKQALALTSVDEEIREEILKNEKLEDKSVKETKEIIKKYKEEIQRQKELNIDLQNKNIEINEVNKILGEQLNSKEKIKEVVEVEVLPKDYEEIKSKANTLEHKTQILEKENNDLKLNIKLSSLNDIKEQEKIKSKLRNFKWLIVNFIEEVTLIGNYINEIYELPEEERNLLINSVKNLVGFSTNLYEQFQNNKKGIKE